MSQFVASFESQHLCALQVPVQGSGFIEGHDTLYTLGDVEVLDRRVNTGPNPFSSNMTSDVIVSLAANPFGNITVTTAGGTSAPFARDVTGLTAVAASGTPTDTDLPSANAGQMITINGTGLTTSLDLVGQFFDDSGILRSRLLNPSAVAGDGTTADFVVPADFNSSFVLGIVGVNNSPMLQIIPTVTSLDVRGTSSSARILGSGFVDGQHTRYTFSTTILDDTERSSGPNVFSGGDTIDLTLPRHGFGTFTISTAGGTSASVALDILNPLVGQLNGVTADGTLVARGSNFHVINTDTGAILSTFASAGAFSDNTGFDLLPEDVMIGGTSVAAGSLIVIDGDESPDRVFFVDTSDGTTIATLELSDSINPIAGAYDTTNGTLFVLDGSPDRVVEISLVDGTIVSEFNSPIGLDATHGGLAFDPDGTTLWIGSEDSSIIVEVQRDGTEIRQVDLSAQSIANEISGFEFDAAGNLLVSSTRGVVYRVDVDAQALRAATRGNAIDIVAPSTDDLLQALTAASESFILGGAPTAVLADLSEIEIQLTDLPGNLLGLTTRIGDRQQIFIDIDAAGNGWSLDPRLQGGMNLLTVVAHELGHILGLDDLDSDSDQDELMYHKLELGEAKHVDRLFANFDEVAVTLDVQL